MCYADKNFDQPRTGSGIWWTLLLIALWGLVALAMMSGCAAKPSPVAEQSGNIGAIQERGAAIVADAKALQPFVAAPGEPLRQGIARHGEAVVARAQAAEKTEADTAKELGRLAQVEWKWENSWFAMKFWRWFWGIFAAWGALNLAAFALTTFAGGPIAMWFGRQIINGGLAMWPASWASRKWGSTPASVVGGRKARSQ